MRQRTVQRLQTAMASAGLDAVVTASPENLAYVNGFVIPSHPLMRWRHAMSVVTADGRCGAVCVDMEESTVAERLPDVDLRVWKEFGGDPMAALGELLEDLGLAGGRLGVELDFLPAGDHTRLRARLPGADLVAADQLLARMRQVKDPEELALLSRLSRIADRAIASSFDAVGPGATEMDIASALTSSVYAQGADQFKLMIVATGERSELPNVGPTNRVLKPQDVCRVEIFPVIDGYQAGVCRTAVVGEPNPAASRIWETLVRCKHQLLETMGPGVPTREVWNGFKREFDALGLPSIDFVGHGIGVHLHEDPYIGPMDDQELESGMVLGVEPLVYRTGMGFGLQLKDMVAITDDGCTLLSDVSATDELPILT